MKQRLQEYISTDEIYQDYKNGKTNLSDFDKFCIQHCKDIEELLNENQELIKINEEHRKLNGELREEKQELKKQLHEASLTIQEMTEQDIECPSNCEKLKKLKKRLEEERKNNYGISL